jgi:hypothetical protein
MANTICPVLTSTKSPKCGHILCTQAREQASIRATDGGEASSGPFVVVTMFAILYELGYNPKVRQWSPSLNHMFPAAASELANTIQVL